MAKLNDTTIEGDLNVSGTLYIGGSNSSNYPGTRWPVETWHSDDYSQGYTKYSDGYKEVWGTATRSEACTFPNSFSFSTTTYIISCTYTSSTSISSSDSPCKVSAKSTTGFTWTTAHSYDNTAYYYCFGY